MSIDVRELAAYAEANGIDISSMTLEEYEKLRANFEVRDAPNEDVCVLMAQMGVFERHEEGWDYYAYNLDDGTGIGVMARRNEELYEYAYDWEDIDDDD